MNDVIETVDSHIEVWNDSDSKVGEFTLLAQRWAQFSLKTHTGELLRKGLEIARALSEFDAELLGREKE